jgi:hypothetical protein
MVDTMRPAALLLACLALGGGAATAAAREPALAPPGSFSISYERSGGLAPSGSKLLVSPGRHAVAESSGSRAGERRVSFRIGRGRVIALERGLRRAGFGSIGNPGDSNCADCFAYAIRYRGHRVSLDESQVPAELGAVIAEIESVVSAHVIPPNA